MAKKSFKGTINPAEMFISSRNEETPAAAPTKEEPKPEPVKKHTPPPGYKINPLYMEKRDKRMQILVTQSLYDKLQRRAQSGKRSMNDIINAVLEAALEKED